VSVPQYDVAAVQRTLAEDPRTAELGVHVRIRGDQLFLTGRVACDRRREAVAQVVAERLPDLVLHNEVQVTRAEAPIGREDLR
jgi:hypothetical protein